MKLKKFCCTTQTESKKKTKKTKNFTQNAKIFLECQINNKKIEKIEKIQHSNTKFSEKFSNFRKKF